MHTRYTQTPPTFRISCLGMHVRYKHTSTIHTPSGLGMPACPTLHTHSQLPPPLSGQAQCASVESELEACRGQAAERARLGACVKQGVGPAGVQRACSRGRGGGLAAVGPADPVRALDPGPEVAQFQHQIQELEAAVAALDLEAGRCRREVEQVAQGCQSCHMGSVLWSGT